MSKEVTMTIRLEPDLRSSFAEAADLEHRPAAQVLRDFMREYVERSRSRAPARSTISAAERKRREDALNYARSSVALEGFSVPDSYTKEAERFIRGEIDLPALTSKVHDIARER
ncbi:hypothetical protein ACPTFP_28950 [Pseudomonas aeruginosa]|uniref:antitoxin VbhA family protein n=1 Tax=Pseudomonas aeruginosa TaxID=287 RepID=UPI003CC69D8F